LWTAFSLSALYWIIAPHFPSSAVLEITNGVLSVVGIAVFVSYSPGIITRMAQTDKVDRVLQLSMGIALSWSVTSILRLWGLMWRKTGQPEWMQTNYLTGYFAFLIICAGVLHITAPGAIDGVVPKRNWIIVGIALGCGIGLAVYSADINFEGFVRMLEPYISVDAVEGRGLFRYSLLFS